MLMLATNSWIHLFGLAGLDPGKAVLVICVILFMVIGINAMIYVSVTRGSTVGQIEMLRRAARRARSPWEQENADLEELSRRVADLKKTGDRQQGQ